MDDTTRMALDVAQSIQQQIDSGATSGRASYPLTYTCKRCGKLTDVRLFGGCPYCGGDVEAATDEPNDGAER